MIDKYLLGTDPEGFLYDHEEKKFTPAIGVIGGGKENPIDVTDFYNNVNDTELDGGFAMLEDNVMVEYNVPPSEKGEKLAEYHRFMTNLIEDTVLEGRYEIRYIPSVKFPESELRHPQACESGCDPDHDVWHDNIREIRLADSNIRYAGGHIHFGVEEELEIEEIIKLVKLWDLCLGVPSVLLDNDRQRRALYGMAGAFRFTDYGFEYRSLSNFWINKHEELITSQVETAIQMFNDGFNPEKEKENILEAINKNNKETAKNLIKKYKL